MTVHGDDNDTELTPKVISIISRLPFMSVFLILGFMWLLIPPKNTDKLLKVERNMLRFFTGPDMTIYTFDILRINL